MHELKKAIEEATSVLFVLPKNAPDRDYLAALQLQKIDPKKIHLVAPLEKEKIWHDFFGKEPSKKEFAITIDTNATPVEELRYEKLGEKLVIYLTHTHAFDTSSISYSEHLPPADLLITLGFKSRKDAESSIETLPRKGIARHIWIEEKNGSSSGPTQTPVLEPSVAGLLGRIMVRSREDKEFQTLWSFITREDFAKTDTSPDSIPHLISTLSTIVKLPRIAALFWQYGENENTEGIIWSEDALLLKTLGEHLGQMPENKLYITLPSYANFIEAETSTRKLLRQVP